MNFFIRKELYQMIKPGVDLSNKMVLKILDFNLHHSAECLTQWMGMSFLCQEDGDGIQGSKLLCLNGWKQFALAVALPSLLSAINVVILPSQLADMGMLWCSHPWLGCCGCYWNHSAVYPRECRACFWHCCTGQGALWAFKGRKILEKIMAVKESSGTH